MYVGTTADTSPTPNPPITLPMYNCVRLVVLIAHSVCTTDPTRKIASAIIKAFFLPLENNQHITISLHQRAKVDSTHNLPLTQNDATAPKKHPAYHYQHPFLPSTKSYSIPAKQKQYSPANSQNPYSPYPNQTNAETHPSLILRL